MLAAIEHVFPTQSKQISDKDGCFPMGMSPFEAWELIKARALVDSKIDGEAINIRKRIGKLKPRNPSRRRVPRNSYKGFYTHKSRGISFTLVYSDLGVKYKDTAGIEHLSMPPRMRCSLAGRLGGWLAGSCHASQHASSL